MSFPNLRLLLAALTVGLVLTIPATASAKSLEQKYTDARVAVVKRFGADAAGRNIRRHGMRTPKGRVVEAHPRHLARSLRQLRRMLHPLPRPTMTRYVGPPDQAPADVATSYGVPPASIAQCESGGDPHAVSSSGVYRGKWQFDRGTWESIGGSGDPAAASEQEQDYRAGLLYAQRGSSPWPICGR